MIDANLDQQLNAFLAKRDHTGQAHEARISALDAAIARGLADADAERTKPADAIFDRLQSKYCALAIE